MNDKIRWAAIQPLTGGMYLGAEEAIGHPAEWILTYQGLDEIKYDKEGNPTSVANETYLLKYLNKVNREVPYYKMKKQMFDGNIGDLDPEITLNGELAKPNYDNLDLVVAVPVCSGLSMVTSAKDDTKNERNSNMLFLANLTLKKIKPKIYIFENAPTLMGSRGEELRKQFEELAEENGYGLIYYKTDTWLHENCQKRPRTFVMFVKFIDGEKKLPKLEFESKKLSIDEFFKSIPEGLSNNDECIAMPHNYLVIDFFKQKHGDDWLDKINGCLMKEVVKYNLFDELLEFMEDYEHPTLNKEKTKKYIDHIKYKTGMGLNWYGSDVCYYKEHFPAIQFRSITTTLHPSGNRICSVREYLELMGMPHDFDWFGSEGNLPKIGQNVPLKTAKFITNLAKNSIFKWNNTDRECGSVIYYDNTTKKIRYMK